MHQARMGLGVGCIRLAWAGQCDLMDLLDMGPDGTRTGVAVNVWLCLGRADEACPYGCLPALWKESALCVVPGTEAAWSGVGGTGCHKPNEGQGCPRCPASSALTCHGALNPAGRGWLGGRGWPGGRARRTARCAGAAYPPWGTAQQGESAARATAACGWGALGREELWQGPCSAVRLARPGRHRRPRARSRPACSCPAGRPLVRCLLLVIYPNHNTRAQAPLRLRTGVLLYGPPGCGKTHIVAAAVAAARARCITVSGPALLNKYIGEGRLLP